MVSSTDQTPLYIACRWGQFPIVEMLVNANADVNIANNQGELYVWQQPIQGLNRYTKLLMRILIYISLTLSKLLLTNWGS